MSCPRCGRRPAEGDRFCGGCGVELTTACPKCGRANSSGAGYCTGCGTRIESEPPGASTEDRRRISVLFVDIVGSTPYAERADPEVVRRMQADFYATARRVVGQYGGVVEKYIGDAVMALFGAPVATETDPLRCVRTGLELQRVLSTFGISSPDSGRDLRFRVGVATGEALVNVAAARDGGQAIVAGDVVNTASRLQSIAPPGGVLVCGQTRALTVDVISYQKQPAAMLRGRTTQTEVWLALAAAQRQHAVEDTLPLIERDHELSLLVNALHRVMRDRTPQLVTIFGQAGIGKSRLVRELYRHTQRLIDEPVTWHTGHCPPFGENVTYAGLADIIKAEAGVLDTDSAETAAARLRQTVRDVPAAGDPARLAAALGPLIGLPRSELPAKDAESAWRRFLVALAARRPTVLVFEDLHWADEAMRRFIELLAAGDREVPLLVLTTARPELVDHDPSWAGTITGSLTVTLSPLRSSGIAALYAQTFGQVAFASDLLQPLVELADGNPLYAQEYVRMLIERGSLQPAGTGWPGSGAELPTPDSVRAVIANRLDLLDPADRAVLQGAAVVGAQFWAGAVAAALERSAAPVEPSLRRLEQREFISEQLDSSVAGESEFRFRHVLVRDVCYERLPRTERVARHERAARWLEALSQDRDSELADVVAFHRTAALEIAGTVGVPVYGYAEAARRALHRAARRAYSLHALESAADHVERALALLGPEASEPDGTVADRLHAAQLELLAAEISFYRDQSGFLAADGEQRLHSLTQRLEELEADREAARAWTLLGQTAWLRADRPAALRFLTRAVALFDQLPDSSEKVDAYAELGRLHMLNYERDPTIAAADSAAAIAGRLSLVEAQMNARITTATARFEAGEEDALAELHKVTDECRRQGLLALSRATRNLAAAVREEGDWRRSDALLSSIRSDVAGGHNLATGYSADAMRAYFHGDLQALAAAADAFVTTPGWQWGDIRLPRLRACVRILRDEPAPDQPELADALTTARASGFRRPLWTALAWEALTCALQRRTEQAGALLDELIGSWQKVEVIASGEWVCAAAYAAALTGHLPSAALHSSLAAQPRQTRWSSAALSTVTGAVMLADGDAAGAGHHHLQAAAVHADIPAISDRMLSLALAANALTRSDAPEEADSALAELREFAHLQSAPGLIRLAQPAG